MTAYFDQLAAEIDKADLETAIEIENRMVATISMACGDRQFPDHMRELIMTCIACNQMVPSYATCPDDGSANQQAIKYFEILGTSKLLGELHGLFHTLASMRVQTRFGLLLDDPEEIVRSRDLHDSE